MNLKKIIIAASVVLLSVTGIQQADAQHVVVRTSHRHHPVVRHRGYHHRTRVVYARPVRHRRAYHYRGHNRRVYHRRHGATVIVR